MQARLQDRVAVITGAGSGIGLATARRFAAEGAKVVVRRPERRRRHRPPPRRWAASSWPPTSPTRTAVQALFDGVAQRHGRVDIAFNNAGISPPDDDSILVTGLDAWERVLRVNTTSVYFCCKYAHPAHARARARARSSTPPRSWR